MLGKNKSVIALGYFDSVHIGHRKVIESAKRIADFNNARLVIFTFKGNLKSVTSKKNEKVVFTDFERKNLYKKLGADIIVFKKITKRFLSLRKEQFLDYLNKKFNAIAYVCGDDYHFGKDRGGNVEFLSKFAKKNSQQLEIVEQVKIDGEKVSTSKIKTLLDLGNIQKANQLLGENYRVTGKVVKDRGVGKSIGFPTANVIIDSAKHNLKFGVYAGKVITPYGKFSAVINYGPRPTFNLDKVVLEAHIIEFNDNLYGKTIVVEFEKFIREVLKFENLVGLINQLKKDVTEVKNYGEN